MHVTLTEQVEETCFHRISEIHEKLRKYKFLSRDDGQCFVINISDIEL